MAPTFTRNRSMLSMTCAVRVDIEAKPEAVWRLLTDAKGFPRWNSTITGIDGQIREGERIRLHVPGTKRTFTPTVSGVVENERMTWADGIAPVFRGVRTFALKPRGGATTEFLMEERFSGVIFALVRGVMPDFRPIFEAFAGDLKREAERIA
ncbi:MAG TPA: SRPBCC domain-containing protein [Burkholderiales bacterium]|nr:SRPBCC domain-containing protein [Burkholderiales bacterium]